MPPGAGLSRVLANAFLPVCIWGMLASLILHLIEVRSLFLRGGEEKLRLAVLAFSLGVILSQRLAAQEGREHAAAYRWALGGAMALFTVYHAFAYRYPVHPLLVILANSVIFTALWWVGTRITAACAVDSDERSAAAAETGILARSRHLRRELDDGRWKGDRKANKRKFAPGEGALSEAEAEKLWRERLPAQHPGRVIFLFSLVAIPAFGLGVFLFESNTAAAYTLGAHLFLYLWSALSLLFLSSFNQLAAYFDRRHVSLPEVVGITWLAIGFAVVSVVVPLAFLLPQPPSPAGGFVRESLYASYRGWESEYGMKEKLVGTEPGGKSGQGAGDPGGQHGGGTNPGAGSGPGKTPGGDSGAAAQAEAAKALGKEAGLDKAYLVKDSGEGRVQAAKEGVGKIFNALVKGVLVLGGLAGVVVVLVILAVLVITLRAQWGSLRPLIRRREQKERKREEKKRREHAVAAFSEYRNPFSPGAAYDDEDLVRYLWRATLAWCEEAGSPCAPDQTPYEFLDSSPPALTGLEEPARRLAHWLMHVEFSPQPLPTKAFDELRAYWTQLAEHARR